jgi:hypothetical protein
LVEVEKKKLSYFLVKSKVIKARWYDIYKGYDVIGGGG